MTGRDEQAYFEYASYYSQSQQWAFLIQPCMYVYTSIDFEWINVYKRIYIDLHQYTQDVIMRLVLEKKNKKYVGHTYVLM